jgi:ribosomal protein S12 methylthiotransferase
MDTWEERPNPRTPVDSSRGTALTTLLRELNAIEGDFWIRLLYTHPAHWSDELIRTIAECPKVARYIDIPLQHISDRMLGRMQRETSGDYIRDLIRRIRAGIPGIAVRTTFIVGFPGETEADVDELCQFISGDQIRAPGRLPLLAGGRHPRGQDARPDSRQGEGSALAPGHGLAAADRGEVSKSHVGRKLKVIVEEPGVARGEADAPDIDGRVYVPRTLPVGEFAEVTITGYRDYDLLALRPGRTARHLEGCPSGPVAF